MRIEKIKAENFKGKSFEYGFGPATLITGLNYKGKSSITQAIRLALTGTMPKPIGKVGGNIYAALAGNPDEAGRLLVSVGLEGGREIEWTWTRNSKGTVSAKGGVPVDLAVPDVVIDPDGFFLLPAAERVAALMASVPDLKIDLEAWRGEMAKIQAFPTSTRDTAIKAATMTAETHFTPGASAVDACKQTIEVLAGMAKEATDTAKAKESAFGALPPITDPPKDRSAELKDAGDELNRLAILKAKFDDGMKTVDATAKRRTDLTQAAERLRVNIAALELPQEFSLKEIVDQQAKIQEQHGEAMKATAKAVAAVENQKLVRAEIQQRLRVFGHSETGKCPMCETVVDAGKLIAQWQEDSDIAQGLIEELEDDAADARETEADLLQKLRSKESEIATRTRETTLWEGYKRELAATEESLKALGESVFPTLPEGFAEKYAEAEKLVAEINENQGRLKAHADGKAWRDKLETDLLEARCRSETLKEAVKLLREQMDKAVNAGFGKVLEVANRFTDGILESSLELRNGELGRRASRGDVSRSLGKLKVGSWIPHEGFSGTERLVAFAGFATAIASTSPIKLVIMDELGRIEIEKREQVVERMAVLARLGVIDQFIGIDSSNWTSTQATEFGVQVIEV
jgi:DNA repair exonuclease SbcCD ATPase subunit